MGRPLNKKYFANTNYQDFGTANVGGESVASVTTVTGDSAGYTTSDTVTFAGPDLINGVTATGTLVIGALGAVTGITVTNPGSGYLTAPLITITTAAGTQTTLTVTAVLTTGAAARQNSIKCEAQVGAGSEVFIGDIIKQAGSKRYKIKTADGTAVCKLVTTADLNANEMSINATDSAGGTYFVKKLTAHKAILVPNTGTQFALGAAAKWTFGSAVLNTTVTIDNQ